jgi:hypothetical protein
MGAQCCPLLTLCRCRGVGCWWPLRLAHVHGDGLAGHGPDLLLGG